MGDSHNDHGNFFVLNRTRFSDCESHICLELNSCFVVVFLCIYWGAPSCRLMIINVDYQLFVWDK